MHFFTHNIADIPLPSQFTWPFHYAPHQLSRIAADEVKAYLSTRKEWSEELNRGKMFGILIVQNAKGEIGFLAAFSGNLAGTNHHQYFVPPVYDMLQPDDFFRREEAAISAINHRITQLEQSDTLSTAREELSSTKANVAHALEQIAAELAQRKAERDRLRQSSDADLKQLILQSQHDKAESKRRKQALMATIAEAEAKVKALTDEIDLLREERRTRSAELQMALFREFKMLNANGQAKDLCEIFAATPQRTPPAGAGAAPPRRAPAAGLPCARSVQRSGYAIPQPENSLPAALLPVRAAYGERSPSPRYRTSA
jgi:tRNA pseudouridine32 synthase/23S rRNA pseudouridine746 synthase